jgi:GH24 family phage-related lysozyme (muramidase)
MNDALNKSVIERHEGRRLVVYLDSRGVKSIAVGFNLEAAGAAAVCARANLNLEALLAGQVITEAQCDAVFELLYEPVAKDARSIFPAIDSYPENAAAVICDMRFELGGAGFRSFHHTVIAFGLRDWPGAIAGIRNSQIAVEVPNRVADNIKLLAAIPA